MTNRPAQVWRLNLRDSLLAARGAGDRDRMMVLRSALSAIDNAETPDSTDVGASPAGVIAGSVAGLGAAEVPRRELTDEQIRDLLRSEIAERLAAAEQFIAGGRPERGLALQAEAAVLTDLLGSDGDD
jgi:uncharacterized protein YqeY